MLILDNWITESISIALSDYVFPILIGAGPGMDTVFSFPLNQPDNFALLTGTTNRYVSTNASIRGKEWVSLDLINQGDPQYFNNLRSLLNPSFNPDNLRIPATVVSPNNVGATIDYKNGTIVKSGAITGTVQGIYTYKKVKIITTWPETVEAVQLPTIAIEDRHSDREPFELFSIRKRERRTLYVDLWASNDGQRGYIKTILGEAFKLSIPLLNLGLGYPLKLSGADRGDRNTSFNANTQRICYLKVEDFQMSNIPVDSGTPDTEKYRSSGKLVVSFIK